MSEWNAFSEVGRNMLQDLWSQSSLDLVAISYSPETSVKGSDDRARCSILL